MIFDISSCKVCAIVCIGLILRTILKLIFVFVNPPYPMNTKYHFYSEEGQVDYVIPQPHNDVNNWI